nr:uncharacterized protein LOC105324382 isoform X3 [Crassostrea gigas]
MHLINLKVILTYMILIILKVEISKANDESCPISRKTVQIVDECPDSLEKWIKAAMRKNCASFANQCSKPRFCTEYSFSGNMIQQNIRTRCPIFQNNRCPMYYRSTDAYKYPGCYKLTKESANVSGDRMTVTVPFSLKIVPKEQKRGDHVVHDVVLILCFTINAVNMLALIGWYCHKRRRQISKENTPTMEKP